MPVGADLQALIDQHAPGQTFVLAAGVHREQSLVPRDGDTFIGEDGAVLDGSRRLDPSAFLLRDGLWVIGGQTQRIDPRQPKMVAGREAEGHAEELFADGRRLVRVAGPAQLDAPGKWWFDHDAAEIVMVDVPTSFQRLDTSTTAAAFTGNGVADVTIRNLEVRRYASPAQRGAIDGHRSSGWHLDRVSAVDNHGVGIGIGSGMVIDRCLVRGNGQLGIGGSGRLDEGVAGDVVEIRSCEVVDNHTLGFDWQWEAGGVKVTSASGAIVTNTRIAGHPGPGLWFDIDTSDVVACANLVEDNLMGIFIETTDGADVFGNAVHDNVRERRVGSEADVHAAFYVSESSDVRIHHNVVWGQVVGVRARQVDREDSDLRLRGLHVHDNDMAFERWTGLTQVGADPEVFDSSVNRFDANTHRSDSPTPFRIGALRADLRTWQARGHDRSGRLLEHSPPGPMPPDVPTWDDGGTGPLAPDGQTSAADCASWSADEP